MNNLLIVSTLKSHVYLWPWRAFKATRVKAMHVKHVEPYDSCDSLEKREPPTLEEFFLPRVYPFSELPGRGHHWCSFWKCRHDRGTRTVLVQAIWVRLGTALVNPPVSLICGQLRFCETNFLNLTKSVLNLVWNVGIVSLGELEACRALRL